MSQANEFRLPDLGEGLRDAEIVSWHVTAGDHVVADQPLLAVETDKAVVEIPAPHAGRIARLHGVVGDRIEVGAVLVEFAQAGGTADVGAIVGDLRREVETPAAPPQPPAVAPEISAATVKASPAARRRAAELGIDLATIQGRGPGGVIQHSDVQAPVAGGVSGEVLRGVRRAMAARMADAHSRVVPASVSDEVDIVAWREGTRPLPRLARAIAKACAAEPHLHVAYDDASGRVMACPKVHLGIAMETDEGLFVPVLRDVGQRTEAELTAAIATLKQAVRARGIAANDLRGQTITLSNYGAVGGRYATMVVVPPQVAIVGAGRIYERVVMVNGAAVAHAVLPLSLTFDHRVVTGVEACRFMATLIADLETST